MKTLQEILIEKAEKNPKGSFDYEGNKYNYHVHNHALITFYYEINGTRKSYLYHRRIKEIIFLCKKPIREEKKI